MGKIYGFIPLCPNLKPLGAARPLKFIEKVTRLCTDFFLIASFSRENWWLGLAWVCLNFM